MIEWESFAIVAIASLLGACAVVTIVAVGLRLFENGMRARASDPSTGGGALAIARVLFALGGLVALFGVYLIVPAFH